MEFKLDTAGQVSIFPLDILMRIDKNIRLKGTRGTLVSYGSCVF